MEVKRKNAPYLNEQDPKEIYCELIIIAGSRVWNAWDKGKGIEWDLFCQAIKCDKRKPPVVLGSTQLQEIERLNLAEPERSSVKIAIFGDLSEQHKIAICYNLAKHSKVNSVHFVDNLGGLIRDETAYIKKLRTGDCEMEEMIIQSQRQPPEMIDFANKPTQKQISNAFLQWIDKPLRRDRLKSQTLEYNGTYWQELADDMLKRKVLEFYDEHNGDYTARQISAVADLVMLKVGNIPQPSPDLIGFQNGVLNKKTGVFNPHNINNYLRGIEHINCNCESKDTPHFDDWLDFVCEGNQNKRNAILAGLFMVMTNHHEWGLFLEATGTAGAGKSVLAQIATIINGTANTATISLADMEEKKSRSILVGKTLAYSPDQRPYKGSADELKAMTGGDPIKVKFVYVDEADVIINAVFMMTTNYPIVFTDRNGGIARRRVIIPFNRAIPKEKKDVHFVEKVQREVYGIVNKLLALFPNHDTARQILEEYKELGEGNYIKQEANHLAAFLSNFYLVDQNDKTARRKEALKMGSARSRRSFDPDLPYNDTLYGAYLFYCGCVNQNPLNLLSFESALPDVFKESGEKAEFYYKPYQGIPTTNAYWKDRKTFMQRYYQ